LPAPGFISSVNWDVVGGGVAERCDIAILERAVGVLIEHDVRAVSLVFQADVAPAAAVPVSRADTDREPRRITQLRDECFGEHAPQFLESQKAKLREVLSESVDAILEGIRTTARTCDQSGALRNITATGAIAFDKLAALEDRPAAVEHQLSADEALLKLQATIGRDFDPTVIDGRATSIPPVRMMTSRSQLAPNVPVVDAIRRNWGADVPEGLSRGGSWNRSSDARAWC
jgi:hypothetical protein